MNSSDISNAAVLRTVYALGGPKHWPTIERIAEHLRCEPEPVRQHLLGYRRQRLLRDRRRKGERVWMPWDAAE